MHVPLLVTSHCLSTFEPGGTTVPSSIVTSSMKFKSLVQGPVVGVTVGRMDVGEAIGVVVGRTSVGTSCVGGTKTVDVAGGAQEVNKKIKMNADKIFMDLILSAFTSYSLRYLRLFFLRQRSLTLIFDYASAPLRPIYISSSAAPPAFSIGSPPISRGNAISPLKAFWRMRPSISAIRPRFWRR